jgi:5-methylcytosine-specific restriction enzyme subunit McrC
MALSKVDETSGLYFDIDLVLRDTSTGEILCVLDTKYKDTTTPATDDVAQIVAYAEKMRCHEAVLVYPRDLPQPFKARVSDIRVRALALSVDGNVEEAGHRFIRTVLGDALV